MRFGLSLENAKIGRWLWFPNLGKILFPFLLQCPCTSSGSRGEIRYLGEPTWRTWSRLPGYVKLRFIKSPVPEGLHEIRQATVVPLIYPRSLETPFGAHSVQTTVPYTQ